MTEFRLTQISDTHLARRLQPLTDNFHRVSEHIDATRPDLVVNSGDLAFDGPTNRDDLEFARDAARRASRSPAAICPAITTSATTRPRSARCQRNRPPNRACKAFSDGDRRRPLALRRRRLVLHRPQFADHEHRACSEAEQFDWLASQLAEHRRQAGRAVPAQAALSEYARRSRTGGDLVPLRAAAGAQRLIEMFGAVDLRLVASGHVHQRRDFTFGHIRHVWAPSAGFIISDARQEVIGIKEVGLVEYRFQPDSFEVRHVRAPGQIDIDLDSLLAMVPSGY